MSMHASHSCCGFREFNGLAGKSPKEILTEMVAADGAASHILFTDVDGSRASTELVKVIESLGLGVVTASAAARNPSSSNTIRGWIFVPNYSKVRTFVRGY